MTSAAELSVRLGALLLWMSAQQRRNRTILMSQSVLGAFNDKTQTVPGMRPADAKPGCSRSLHAPAIGVQRLHNGQTHANVCAGRRLGRD